VKCNLADGFDEAFRLCREVTSCLPLWSGDMSDGGRNEIGQEVKEKRNWGGSLVDGEKGVDLKRA